MFTHLAVSLWGSREITRRYLGRDFHDRVVERILDRPDHMDLRLSAVAGSDWLTGPAALIDYILFAKDLGASQVTIREMQPSNQGDKAWMTDRQIGIDRIEQVLAESGQLARVSANGSLIFDVRGVEVCAYRYPEDADDNDFVYLRPDRHGQYGTFFDFDNDEARS